MIIAYVYYIVQYIITHIVQLAVNSYEYINEMSGSSENIMNLTNIITNFTNNNSLNNNSSIEL